jgi:hypothetical protein
MIVIADKHLYRVKAPMHMQKNVSFTNKSGNLRSAHFPMPFNLKYSIEK